MKIWHGKSRRKSTGRRYRYFKKKRKYETQGRIVQTKVGERELEKIRTRGGNEKIKLKGIDLANVYDPKSKKVKRVKIDSVIKNPANGEYARLNLITKGAILDTDLGEVKVTNRPGQSGIVNGVLLKKEE